MKLEGARRGEEGPQVAPPVDGGQGGGVAADGSTEPDLVPARRPGEIPPVGPAARPDLAPAGAVDHHDRDLALVVVFEERHLVALRRDADAEDLVRRRVEQRAQRVLEAPLALGDAQHREALAVRRPVRPDHPVGQLSRRAAARGDHRQRAALGVRVAGLEARQEHGELARTGHREQLGAFEPERELARLGPHLEDLPLVAVPVGGEEDRLPVGREARVDEVAGPEGQPFEAHPGLGGGGARALRGQVPHRQADGERPRRRESGPEPGALPAAPRGRGRGKVVASPGERILEHQACVADVAQAPLRIALQAALEQAAHARQAPPPAATASPARS